MDAIAYRRGITLFNDSHFYDAHEVLEDVWRAAPEAEKKFLQGLIQIAVALHHYSTGNLVGARSLLQRGAKNLAPYPANFAGMDLAGFLKAVAQWSLTLQQGGDSPPLPRMELNNPVLESGSQ